MVADAFDSMTSTRGYDSAKSVDEAIAELIRCQGAQFDAVFVECLVRSVRKLGWELTPEDPPIEELARADSTARGDEPEGGRHASGQ
jgi:HD-GYP domain-containing protein (c-di-GMP phosphodiesterase class II)